MPESTWLPGPTTAAEETGRATPWWLRLVFVVVFHALVVLGQWWALAPDATNPLATPGLVPGLLVGLAWLAFLLVLFQVSARVNLWLMAGGLLLGLAAQWVLTPAVGDLYHNFAMQRSDDAVVTRSAVSVDNGVTLASLRLSDGRTTEGILTVPAREDRFTRQSRGFLQPVHFGPFVEPGPGSHVDVLVDPHGISPAVNADRDDTTPAGRRVALWWLLGAVVAWLPLELLVASSLTRRRSWWQLSADELAARRRA